MKYVGFKQVDIEYDTHKNLFDRLKKKIDSGQGCVNSSMLAQLRIRGFYLIPGVPNTTHVTRAADRNYGLFKSVY